MRKVNSQVCRGLNKMENVIASLIVYCAFALFVLCNLNEQDVEGYQGRKRKKKQQEVPIIDISCIFEEEKEIKPKKYKQQDSLTVKELRKIAKERNVQQAYKLSKAQLIRAIYDRDIAA